MTTHELMRWAAFEQVHGPLLVHDRVDLGFAKMSYYLVSLLTNGKRKHKFRDFLPKWITDQMRRAPIDERRLEAVFQSWAAQEEPQND